MMLYTHVLLDKTSSYHFLNDPCWAVIQKYVLCMVFALYTVFSSHAHSSLCCNHLISLIMLF